MLTVWKMLAVWRMLKDVESLKYFESRAFKQNTACSHWADQDGQVGKVSKVTHGYGQPCVPFLVTHLGRAHFQTSIRNCTDQLVTLSVSTLWNIPDTTLCFWRCPLCTHTWDNKIFLKTRIKRTILLIPKKSLTPWNFQPKQNFPPRQQNQCSRCQGHHWSVAREAVRRTPGTTTPYKEANTAGSTQQKTQPSGTQHVCSPVFFRYGETYVVEQQIRLARPSSQTFNTSTSQEVSVSSFAWPIDHTDWPHLSHQDQRSCPSEKTVDPSAF